MSELSDRMIPLKPTITAWSPFIPNDEDDSSMPVAALEYSFFNPATEPIHAVWSFHTLNFMSVYARDRSSAHIESADNGFLLRQAAVDNRQETAGAFCATVDDENVVIDCAWFRGRIGRCLDCLSMIEGLGNYTQVKLASESIDVEGLRLNVLMIDALIKTKKAMNRPRDIEIIRQLEAIKALKRDSL